MEEASEAVSEGRVRRTFGEIIDQFDIFFVRTYARKDMMPVFDGKMHNPQWRQLNAKMFLVFSPFGYTVMTPDSTGTFVPTHLDRKNYEKPLDAASQALVKKVLKACAECEKGEFLAPELAARQEVVRRFTDMVGGAC